MKYRKKTIKRIIFFLVTVPPAVMMWIVVISFVSDNFLYEAPQLSEHTVLSLSDNMSNLAITGNANFKDNRFQLLFGDN